MKAEPTPSHHPADTAKQHSSFFKQSGWLMMATIAGGILTWGVHFLSKSVPKADYSVFGTLLMVTAILPTMPLQMMFAAQTAGALATGRERELSGKIRLAFISLFVLWLMGAVVVFVFQESIITAWKLSSPAPLWITVATLLVGLWMPMFNGVLQGCQDFFMMGWSAIFNGVLRVIAAGILVLALGLGASGMVSGALAGLGFAALLGIWRTRDLWLKTPEKIDALAFARQVAPLMLGFGAFQFMFTSDTMYAQAFFTADEMAPYVAAGTLSRALLWLVLPLAAVMFPKLVHSNAKAEKTNLLKIVLLGTAVLSICGGLGLWLVGPIVVKIVYKAGYVEATTALLPWYAMAMVPLALANVLVNDLLARSRFRVVPFILMVAVGYGFALPWALNHVALKLVTVLQTLGIFNCLLLAVCVWGAFGKDAKPNAADRLQ
ncbi:MAG: hypothetical protein U1F65_01600 [Verrucomicrobiota bacterium]